MHWRLFFSTVTIITAMRVFVYVCVCFCKRVCIFMYVYVRVCAFVNVYRHCMYTMSVRFVFGNGRRLTAAKRPENKRSPFRPSPHIRIRLGLSIVYNAPLAPASVRISYTLYRVNRMRGWVESELDHVSRRFSKFSPPSAPFRPTDTAIYTYTYT